MQSVTIQPLGITLITNDQGEFTYDVGDAENLTFTVEDNPTFPFNTSAQSLTYDAESITTTSFQFGLAAEAPEYNILVHLFPDGNAFLCNGISEYDIAFRNMGNLPLDGTIELQIDPLFQGYEVVTQIDSANNNSVYMSFDNLSCLFVGKCHRRSSHICFRVCICHIGEDITTHFILNLFIHPSTSCPISIDNPFGTMRAIEKIMIPNNTLAEG